MQTVARSMSLCEALREAFLRGEVIHAIEFAKTQQSSRQAVYLALSKFGSLVKRGGGRYGSFVCADMTGMQLFNAPAAGGRTRGSRAANSRGRQVTPWDALLLAWGLPLQPVDLQLPRHLHVMTISDDQTETV